MSEFDSLVCIHQDGQPNRWVPSQDLANKTVKQIQTILNIQDQILIQTPLYRTVLDPESIPLTEYEQLIVQLPRSKPQDKYPPSDFHLCCLPLSNKCVNSLTTEIRTQLTETVFPNIIIAYDPDTCKTVQDWLALASKTFNMGCSDEKLIKISDQSEVNPTDSISSILDQSIAQIRNKLTEPIFAFSCTIPDDSLKNISRRCQTAAEIISSEGSFVNDLNNLISYYQPEIEQSSIFDQANTKYIFNDIPKILDTHQHLYKELEKIKVNYAAAFGAIFLNFLDNFKKSLPFISGFKNVDDTIKKKLEANSYKRMKFEEIEDNCPTGKSFMSYYITPVQRYPRYPLLIRDLLKVTPDFHPDKPYLQKALTDIDNMNKSLDQTSAKVSQLLLIQEIEKKTDFCIADDGREFIMQMNVRIAKPKSMAGIIYLFNNFIMITQAKKNCQNVLKTSDLLNFRFFNSRPSPESIAILLEGKLHTIYFEEYADKKNWIEAFNKCRIKELSNVNAKNNFIKWVDLEMGETIYPLLGHSGDKLNNEIIFVGGLNQSNSPTSSMIIYNIEESKWSSAPTQLPPLSFHTITNYNDNLYLAFGQGARNTLNEIWKYDGNEWAKVCSSKNHRFGHTTVVYNDLLYIFGGKNQKEFLNDMLVFNPSDNTIESIQVPSSGPSPRYLHSACVFNDSMLIIGGKTERSLSNEIFKYDFKTKEWTQFPCHIQAVYGHKSIILAHKYLFVIGGSEAGGKESKIKCINMDTMQALKIDHFGNRPCGLFRFAIAQLSDYRAIVYGGNDQFYGSKVALSCAYIMDVEEGFQENRQYIPSERKDSRRQISLFDNSSSETLIPSSPTPSSVSMPNSAIPTPETLAPPSSLNPIPPPPPPPPPPMSTPIIKDDSFSTDSQDSKPSEKIEFEKVRSSSIIDASLASNPLFNKRKLVNSNENPNISLLQPPSQIDEQKPSSPERKRSQTVEAGQKPLPELHATVPSVETNQSTETKQGETKKKKHKKKKRNSHHGTSGHSTNSTEDQEKTDDEQGEYDASTKEDSAIKSPSNSNLLLSDPNTSEVKTEPAFHIQFQEPPKDVQIKPLPKHPISNIPTPPTSERFPLKPTRVYSSSIIHPNINPRKEFVPNPDLKLSPTFKPDEIFVKFSIDTTQMNSFELGRIQMQAKRLFIQIKNNEDLEAQIASSRHSETSKDSFVLKVSDEFNKTRVAKVHKDDSYESVLAIIGHLNNKDCANCEFSMQLPGEDPVEFSPQTYQEMKEKMVQKDLSFMKISEL